MGQTFYLVNMDSAWYKGRDKLGEIFCYQGLHVHIRHFTVPTSWSERSQALLRFRYPRVAHRSSKSASKLLLLPDEILSMIFDSIDSLCDAACLCLADGVLFAVGFPRVVKLQKPVFANWAGYHVVCLGQYTRDDDYPESIRELVEDWLKRNPSEDPEYDLTFKDLMLDVFQEFEGGTCSIEPSRQLDDADLGRDKGAFNMIITPRYESTHPWVLCNLSKGEYVRAEAIASLTGSEGNTPFIQHAVRLDHALLSQICWSSDGSIAMENKDNLHRGPWAGDCFEVTSMDELKATIEWKDISDEVVETLDKTWSSEYGEDWREAARTGRLSSRSVSTRLSVEEIFRSIAPPLRYYG
ncbi:hypothetical protein BC835DRAFT_1365229 [Cytidiella melzeri]|nr:hypothetical protein BC835DRAFT_1365229 [Cytidiella melzeri]